MGNNETPTHEKEIEHSYSQIRKNVKTPPPIFDDVDKKLVDMSGKGTCLRLPFAVVRRVDTFIENFYD